MTDTTMSRKEELLREICVRCTEAHFGAEPEDAPKETPERAALIEFLKRRPFGCQSAEAARVTNLILEAAGQKALALPDMGDGGNALPWGVVAVALEERNAHSYGVGQPFFSVGQSEGGSITSNALRINANGNLREGNHLHAGTEHRAATRDEIEAFVQRLLADDDFWRKAIEPFKVLGEQAGAVIELASL